MSVTIRLQREAFDVAAETARMTHGRTDIGALVTFTGLCRADENGKAIAALTLEHYSGMAEAEIGRHVFFCYADPLEHTGEISKLHASSFDIWRTLACK